MIQRGISVRALLFSTLALALLTMPVRSQTQGKVNPSLTPIAETKLLMQGIANANYRGLEKLLKTKPSNIKAWNFARGQALLIAEMGNLLMIRPPTGAGRDVWFKKAMNLRSMATELAKSTAKQDYGKSKVNFLGMVQSCNSCHQTFQVQVKIVPYSTNTGL